MSCTVTVKYNRKLVRQALNRYMVRRLGKSFVIAFAAAIGIIAFSFFTGAWSWFLTLFTAILIAALSFLLFIYFARLRAAEGFFAKANEPTVTFEFTAEGVHTVSVLGTSNLHWPVFDEILKFPDIWLLVYAKSGYMTLPLEQLTPACREFIEQQISIHRNKATSKA